MIICQEHEERTFTIQEATEIVANNKGTDHPRQYGYCASSDSYHVRPRIAGHMTRYDLSVAEERTHSFEVSLHLDTVRLEMSPDTAALLSKALHQVDSQYLLDDDYMIFNEIRKQLSVVTGRSS